MFVEHFFKLSGTALIWALHIHESDLVGDGFHKGEERFPWMGRPGNETPVLLLRSSPLAIHTRATGRHVSDTLFEAL